jgi:hypothetical protein
MHFFSEYLSVALIGEIFQPVENGDVIIVHAATPAERNSRADERVYFQHYLSDTLHPVTLTILFSTMKVKVALPGVPAVCKQRMTSQVARNVKPSRTNDAC